MPELPEVETVCQSLRTTLEGRSFQKIQCNRPDLRFPLPFNLEGKLNGHPVLSVIRRAKYILIHFNHGLTLVWHLGMSGRIIIENLETPVLKTSPHDHVIFTTSHDYKITYRDPRRFGFLLLTPTHELGKLSPFGTLGPEPFDDSRLNAVHFHDCLNHHSISIKSALLNQKIIAGLGNIYACEALWQAKISPLRLTNRLTLAETGVLLREIQDVLRRAIAAGGSTLRDHIHPNGDMGYFQHFFKAYNREGFLCEQCLSSPIVKITQNGRSTYYCKSCQQ
jgi:formamidopyrimidine-DNA glycosylase